MQRPLPTGQSRHRRRRDVARSTRHRRVPAQRGHRRREQGYHRLAPGLCGIRARSQPRVPVSTKLVCAARSNMPTFAPPLRLLAGAMLVATALLATACPRSFHSPTDPSRPPVDEVVTLAFGDEARLRSWLSVSLDRVVSDSRCPTGATCVWEGEVAVALTLRSEGHAFRFTLSDHATTAAAGPCAVTLLTVAPYPKLNEPIPVGAYRVTIRVRSFDGR